MQRLCFHTTGQHFSAGRSNCVVRTCQTGNGVEQDNYIVTALYQSFGFLVNDVCYAHMIVSRLIEGRGNHFGVYAALHIGYLLRTLVDKKDNHIDLGVVLQNSVSQLLEQHRLTGFRLCYDQSALTFADRREQVYHTNAQRVVMTGTEFEFLVREEWGEVLEGDTMFRHLGRQTVNTNHFLHREEFLRLRIHADGALDGVAGFESVLANLVFAHVDIVRAGEVVIVGGAKESVAVRCTLESTHGNHVLAQVGNNQFFFSRLCLRRRSFGCCSCLALKRKLSFILGGLGFPSLACLGRLHVL